MTSDPPDLRPTLLIPGKLVGHPGVAGVDFVTGWLRRRLPELGGAPPRALADRVLVVRSATGSGKSTALPVYVFRLLRSERSSPGARLGGAGVICTQPRVLTAQSLARDVAQSPHYPDMVLGETVGYQTGPVNEKPARGLIYATAGTLQAQLRLLPDEDIYAMYRFIIVDEAHERSLEIDSLLMRLKALLKRGLGRPRLPFVILASATIPVQKYARFFEVGDDNIVEVKGRTYPVPDFYPLRGTNDYLREAAAKAVELHRAHPEDPPARADILVFLPGKAEIENVRDRLLKENQEFLGPGATARPFCVLVITRDVVRLQTRDYALLTAPPEAIRLPAAPRGPGDEPGHRRIGRRIILATTVAETGLTIDTLKYVIDSGWSRTVEVYYPSPTGGLVTRPAPQSRVRQRRGRAGRLFPGEFHPLYTKNVHDQLEPDQPPEIVARGITPIFLDAATVATEAADDATFRIGDLDMLDLPSADALAAAFAEALAGGMLGFCPGTKGHRLTSLGEKAARFDRLGMNAARTAFAGHLWGAAGDDIALIIALFAGRPAVFLRPPPDRRPGEPWEARALRAGLPDFLREMPPGAAAPRRLELAYLRARLLLQDDFLEMLLVFDGFVRALDDYRGDFAGLELWCVEHHLDLEELLGLAAAREAVLEELVAAGIAPLENSRRRLAAAGPEDFFDRVFALKRAIYAGLWPQTLVLDEASGKYRFGGRLVAPPARYSDKHLRWTRDLAREAGAAAPAAALSPPRRLVASRVRLAPARSPDKKKPPPLYFTVTPDMVSALDGYVPVDESLWLPRTVTSDD